MTIPLTADPITLFQDWLHEAEATEPNDPTAVCLASVDSSGQPSARMVLCRGIDSRGFTFFTNFESRKGIQLLATPKAAMCFHWKSLRRQVRIEGAVEIVTEAEADDYYNGRPRDSRISSWASLQSQPLPDRQVFLDRLAMFEEKYAGLDNPPRPPHWSGFRLVPHLIEFWKDGEFRRHDRLQYTRDAQGGWATEWLYP